MGKVTIPAKLENLDLMISWILKSADLAGFDEKNKSQIRLASEEILVNIINYAYSSKSGAIELSLNPKPKESLEIVFADWGIEFNPLSLSEPKICAPIEERKIGGLGIYLVRKVMDEVNYKREGGRNILTVIKKLKNKK
jgi:anti-sigma regulatory factor (Ser/Thr protein kinase)